MNNGGGRKMIFRSGARLFGMLAPAALLMLAGCAGSADTRQEDARVVRFVSTRQSFSLEMPADWSTVEILPGAALLMANSRAAMERHRSDKPPAPGDVVVNVGFLPFLFLERREYRSLGIRFEAGPDALLRSILQSFRTAPETKLSDLELVSVDAGRPAALLRVWREDREGTVVLLSAGEEVVTLISAMAYPGEAGPLEVTVLKIAASVTFTGEQDALNRKLMEDRP